MDPKQLANGALVFMARAQLQGAEYDAFGSVVNFLKNIASGALDVVPAEIQEQPSEGQAETA